MRALVPDHEGVGRRLGDDEWAATGHRVPAGCVQLDQPGAAGLLAGGEHELHAPTRVRTARVLDRGDHRRGHAGLHVARAAAHDLVAVAFGRPRVDRPVVGLDGDGVEVAGERERRPVAARRAGDELLPPRLPREQLGAEPGLLHQGSAVPGRGALAAADRPEPDQLAQQAEDVGHRSTSPLVSGRVRITAKAITAPAATYQKNAWA
nr:hypothetical protein [Pseudonocardia hierapolitana]